MIENLKGVYETVNFKKQSGIKLYLNDSLTDYPLHWHTPIEIVAPEKGHYHVTCADRDYDLNEGDILFIAPGTLHSMSPEGEPGSRAIIQIDTSTIRGVQNTDSILSFISPSFLVTEKTFEKELYAAIRFFIWRIKVEYNGDNPFFEPAIYGIFLNILSLIGQSKAYRENVITEQCTKNREYVEKFLSICDYINDSLKVGDVIEVFIKDVGKKGDGTGKFMDYLVVVPGTVKGAKVNAKITNISAKTAFAQRTNENPTR